MSLSTSVVLRNPTVILTGGSDQNIAGDAVFRKLTIWTATGGYNPGNIYASGIVTVPIPGVYDITATAMTDVGAGGESIYLAAYVNGSQVKIFAQLAYENFINGSVILKLNASDQVAIYGQTTKVATVNFLGATNPERTHFSVCYRPGA